MSKENEKPPATEPYKTCGDYWPSCDGTKKHTIARNGKKVRLDKKCPGCPDCKPAVNATQPTELAKELLELANLSPKQRAKTGWSGTDEKAMRKAATELDRQAGVIKRLTDVIKRCIKAMAGSNCLELKWLEVALKPKARQAKKESK